MISCENTPNKTKSENKSLFFNINHNLLNKTPLKNDEGFSIYAPLDWLAIDPANFTQLRKALEANENLIQLELIGGYQSKDLASCIISKINSIKEDFQYIPENYLSQEYKIIRLILLSLRK